MFTFHYRIVLGCLTIPIGTHSPETNFLKVEKIMVRHIVLTVENLTKGFAVNRPNCSQDAVVHRFFRTTHCY